MDGQALFDGSSRACGGGGGEGRIVAPSGGARPREIATQTALIDGWGDDTSNPMLDPYQTAPSVRASTASTVSPDRATSHPAPMAARRP